MICQKVDMHFNDVLQAVNQLRLRKFIWFFVFAILLHHLQWRHPFNDVCDHRVLIYFAPPDFFNSYIERNIFLLFQFVEGIRFLQSFSAWLFGADLGVELGAAYSSSRYLCCLQILNSVIGSPLLVRNVLREPFHH